MRVRILERDQHGNQIWISDWSKTLYRHNGLSWQYYNPIQKKWKDCFRKSLHGELFPSNWTMYYASVEETFISLGKYIVDEPQFECTCAMTEGSQFHCRVHGGCGHDDCHE